MLIFNKNFITLIDSSKEGKVGGLNCNGYHEKQLSFGWFLKHLRNMFH